MITNPKLLQKAEDDFIRKNKMTIRQKYKMLDEMYFYAKKYGKKDKDKKIYSDENFSELISFAKKLYNVPETAVKAIKGTGKK